MLSIYPNHPQQSTKYPSFKGHPSNFKPYKAERDYLTIHAYIARKFQYSENKLTQFIDKNINSYKTLCNNIHQI